MRCLLILSFLAVCFPLHADDAKPKFSDDFERDFLGDWKVIIPGFKVEDGHLTGWQAKADHGAVGRVYIPMSDAKVSFRFRLAGSPRFNVVFDDKYHKGSHAGHICRVAVSEKQIRLGDDKEGIMRNDIFAMRRNPDQKEAADKLLVGKSVAAKVDLKQMQWYTMTIAIVGDQMQVSLDGQPLTTLKSPGLAHPTKESVHFTVNGPGVHFDDVVICCPVSPDLRELETVNLKANDMANEKISDSVLEAITRGYPDAMDLKKTVSDVTVEFSKSYPKLTQLIRRSESCTFWVPSLTKGKKSGKRAYFWKCKSGGIVGLVVDLLSAEAIEENLKHATVHHRLLIKEFGVIVDDCVFADEHNFGLPAINAMFYAVEIPDDFQNLYESNAVPPLPSIDRVAMFGNQANGDYWVYDKLNGIVYNVTAFGPVSTRGLIRVGKTEVYKFPDDRTFDEYVESFAERNLKQLMEIKE